MPNIQIFAQSEDSDSSVLFISEYLGISLDLISKNVKDGDFDGAKTLSKLNSEIFPIYLQSLRQSDPDVTDEIHLLLLDIHDKIDDEDSKMVLEKIELVNRLLVQYSINSPDYGFVISQMLIVVDEQYQIAINEENSALYDLSLLSVNKTLKFALTNNFRVS